MKDSKFLFATLLVTSALLWPLYQVNVSASTLCGQWKANFHGAAAVGDYIGQDKNYVEIGSFIFSEPRSYTVYFTDVCGFILEKDCYASNVGVGFRTFQKSNGLIYGGNFYYDYFSAETGGFNRLGMGIELLGNCLDLRINGYIPVNQCNQSSKREYNYEGDYTAECRRKEFAFTGMDAEIGKCFYGNRCFSFYGAVGSYYYSGCDLPHVFGGSSRLSVHLFNYIQIEGFFSYDHEYHLNGLGKIAISIPLDKLFFCSNRSIKCSSLNRPVQRNRLPFFYKCCDWDWNW